MGITTVSEEDWRNNCGTLMETWKLGNDTFI